MYKGKINRFLFLLLIVTFLNILLLDPSLNPEQTNKQSITSSVSGSKSFTQTFYKNQIRNEAKPVAPSNGLSDLNVTGVRAYKYYPLYLNNPLFIKNSSYSQAEITENFVTVFGFNETEKTHFIDFLNGEDCVLSGSVSDNHTMNYIHFRFNSTPEIDCFVLPYLIITTQEICNSTQWMPVAQMRSIREDFLLISNNRIIDLFGYYYTLASESYYCYPCVNNPIAVLTSIQNVTPSIHEHYDLNGSITDNRFLDLLTSIYRGFSVESITAELMSWDLGLPFNDYFHLILYSTAYSYHDITLISYEDNPRVHCLDCQFSNPIFPLGQSTFFSIMIWHIDSLLRYACNHVVQLREEMLQEFTILDEIIQNVIPGDQLSLQEQLNKLSIDVKSNLTDYQTQIFDLTELILHCSSIWYAYEGTAYMAPFSVKFQQLVQELEAGLLLAQAVYSELKDDYDSTLQIVNQLLADAHAQNAILHAWNQLFYSVLIAIIIALFSILINIYLQYRRERSSNRRDGMVRVMFLTDIFESRFSKSELTNMARDDSIPIRNATKRELALRIITKKGAEWATDNLTRNSE